MIVDALLGAARLILAAVFAVAGAAKLVDATASRRELVDFDIPERPARLIGFILPPAEIGLALALLFRSTAVPAAIGVLVLLLAFVAAMARIIARGRRPDCHCFGQLYSAPVGAKAFLRNGVLAAAAGFVIGVGWTDPGPSFFAWLTLLSSAELAVVFVGTIASALLAVQSALLIRLSRQTARVIDQLSSLPWAPPASETPAASTLAAVGGAQPPAAGLMVGSQAPAFSLTSLDEATVTLDMLRAQDRSAVLIFSDPNCQPCGAMLPDVANWQQQHAGTVSVAIISRGTREANRAKIGQLPLTHVLLQRDREVAEAYQAFGTPSAVLVRPDGTIGSPLVMGGAAIGELVERTSRQSMPESGSVPAPAPDFSLPDLDGRDTTLADFRGNPTLLLFWNPGCGYCQRMLADLRAWEDQPVEDRIRLLVISTGSVEDNRALGLRSVILLDHSFEVARQFGAEGTPSAVLVDGQGRTASRVATGAEAFFGLAGPIRRELPPDARPTRPACVMDELLADGSIVLYDECRSRLLTLNATGALVWDCCDGEHDVYAIASELRDVFPAASDTEADVRQVLKTLLEAGMVELAPAGAPSATLTGSVH